jgi:hypothetical protein
MPTINPLSVRGDRWLNAISAAILAALTAAVAVGKPGHAAWLPPCPLHAFTGFLCPGCGSTRALYYLVHGHPLAAFRENELAVVLLPFVIYELSAILTLRWPSVSARLRPWTLWALLALVILFGVMRNLPWFASLAPANIL